MNVESTGTGLLAIFSAQAGARTVYAVEASAAAKVMGFSFAFLFETTTFSLGDSSIIENGVFYVCYCSVRISKYYCAPGIGPSN